jgi:predicted PurR-regulated permease PerM
VVRSDRLIGRALPIYLALLLALLSGAALLLAVRLAHVLLIVFISMLFAAALTGPTEWLADHLHVPRVLSAIAIYVVMFALVVGIGWLVLPPLSEQVADFANKAPGYVDRYDNLREKYERLRSDYPALPKFDDQVDRIQSGIVGWAGSQATSLPARLFTTFLDLLSIFVISLMLVTNRERIRGFVLSLVHPSHRGDVAELLDSIWARIGTYLRAKIIVMAIVGAVTYGALLVIGVPFAVPLAIIVSFGEIIPRAGPWLARIPLLAIAGLQGPKIFVLTFVASVVIENLKGYVISPFVEGDQLDIHPLLVFISVLIGATLGGPAGAFVAVPLAAVIDLIIRDVVIPWRRHQIEVEQPEPPILPV